MTPQWEAIDVGDQVVHIVPIGDFLEHEHTDECACGPTSEVVIEEGRTDGWIVTHHSLDGRESREPS